MLIVIDIVYVPIDVDAFMSNLKSSGFFDLVKD